MRASIPRLLCALAVALVGALPARSQEASIPEVINVMCPVMTDQEVDEDSITVVHDGKAVRLCCKRCQREFLSDPEKYLNRLPQFGTRLAERPGADLPVELRAALDLQGEGGAVPARIGRLHPVVVHFPIALLLVATMFEAWSLVMRRATYGATVRPLVRLGAVTGCVAAALGLILEPEIRVAGWVHDVLDMHRLLGLLVPALAAGAAVLGEVYRRRGRAYLRWSYLGLLALTATAVAVAAHLGGELVYGPDYLMGAG